MARKPDPDTLDVEIPGGLGIVSMRRLTARQYIAIKQAGDVEIMEMTVAAIATYLPGKDPWDLPPLTLLGLTSAWLDKSMEEAVPPPTA